MLKKVATVLGEKKLEIVRKLPSPSVHQRRLHSIRVAIYPEIEKDIACAFPRELCHEKDMKILVWSTKFFLCKCVLCAICGMLYDYKGPQPRKMSWVRSI